jgi:hypothetical protein
MVRASGLAGGEAVAIDSVLIAVNADLPDRL